MTEFRTLMTNFIKKSATVGLLKNDGTVDTTDYVSTSNTEGLIKNDGTIDPSDYVEKSSTVGLLKNDGTIDTTEYLTGNEEVIFVNGTNQSTDTTTNTFTGTTSKLDSISSVVDGTKLVYKVSVTSTNDTNDLRLNLGTGSGTIERYIKSGNSYTTANLYPTYTLLFLVFFNGAWHIIGQSNPKLKNRIVDLIYPIGSIYMSVNNVSPQTLFGGTWEQIQDKFLLASGSTYSNGATGGSADAVLVSHNHGTNTSGEYFVTSESSDSNNTRVTYSSSGNRYVDGMNASTTPFHHRIGTNYVGSSGTGKNMPPYLAVNVWKRTA